MISEKKSLSDKKGSKLSTWNYFGDDVMMGNSHEYNSTVKTLSKTTCWKLERQVLIKLKKQFESVNSKSPLKK